MASKRGRTISLKGAAAAAFIGMVKDKPVDTEDELLTRVATLVHMHMAAGDVPTAVSLLKGLLVKAQGGTLVVCSEAPEGNDETVQKA
jgi:hypothetical protein